MNISKKLKNSRDFGWEGSQEYSIFLLLVCARVWWGGGGLEEGSLLRPFGVDKPAFAQV